jgi:hypothetical protein
MRERDNNLTSQPDLSHFGPIEAPPGKPTQNLRYVLIIPVWGDHHTTLFLRYCIPFLLTDGNVGAFPDRRLQVHIASRRSDFVRMNQDANYRSLAAAADLRETEIDDLVNLSVPHRAMTECYLHVIRSLPQPDDTVTILPTPDCILSRNALKKIIERMEGGWRAVMVCGLRLTLETAGPVLDQMIASPEGAAGLNERELCSVALNNLHPITLSCNVASEEFMVTWPSHVYWVAPDRSWLMAHCFHLHPIAVRGVPRSIDIHSTIDGDYLLGLGAVSRQLCICPDSDDFFCVELSPHAKRILGPVGRLTKRALVRFSVSGCNPLHRGFFAQCIRWRGQREARIPEDVLCQAEEFCIAVERGSKLEELRHAVKMMIMRIPLLLLVARFSLRATRWAMRRARQMGRAGRWLLSQRRDVKLG